MPMGLNLIPFTFWVLLPAPQCLLPAYQCIVDEGVDGDKNGNCWNGDEGCGSLKWKWVAMEKSNNNEVVWVWEGGAKKSVNVVFLFTLEYIVSHCLGI